MRALPILFRDPHLVAVNKPSGLLVHRSPVDRHETVYAMQVLRDQLGQRVYPLHRLDKATSGVLVFALDQRTAGRMTMAFSAGQVAKSYLAVVRGFTNENGCIDHPLKDLQDRMSGPGAAGNRKAKDAVTDYRRLATIELPYPVGRYASARYSLLRAVPRTGRTHQLRRHLKHIFHPIIGDTTYGDGKQNELFRAHFACRRLLLHAEEIAFPHPASGLPVRVRAPLDPHFSALLEKLAWGTASLVGPDGAAGGAA